MARVLILTDGKVGHENQSKAFARALGCDYDLVGIHFKSKFHKALSYLFDHLSIRTTTLYTLVSPPSSLLPHSYTFIIGTGSGTFYAAKALAKKWGVKCGVVLYPRGYDIASFDCILAPAFDRPPKAPNVIEIPANLVANDAAFYEKGVESFKEHYARTTSHPSDFRPLTSIAVIIGGPNKCSTMTAEWMKEQLDKIFKTELATDGFKPQFWVTTSRRTPPDVEAVVDSYPWDYKLLYSKDHFNPIPAFVQLAKKLYVTAESTGMLSEACTFGTATVVALDNLNPGPHKFRRFVDDLRAVGYVDGNRKVDMAIPFAAAQKLMGR